MAYERLNEALRQLKTDRERQEATPPWFRRLGLISMEKPLTGTARGALPEASRDAEAAAIRCDLLRPIIRRGRRDPLLWKYSSVSVENMALPQDDPRA
jgi:hypothetical protein